MNKEEIIQMLTANHQAFVTKLEGLSEEDFTRVPGNKWTSGQQLDHILKSVVPTAKIFNTDPSVLKAKFGLAQKPSRTYPKLVEDYLKVLQKLKDFVLPERFVPTKIKLEDRNQKLSELLDAIKYLNDCVTGMEDSILDSHATKHPAMGMLSLREILYFTAYHVTHHDRQILENLENYPV